MKIIKRLAKCIGEYKKDSIITPVLIAFEVMFECILPLITSSMINSIQSFAGGGSSGAESSDLIYVINNAISSLAGGDVLISIVYHGIILIVIAILSLICGGLAGKTVANASAGFGKNLRKEIYYNIQDFSFSNIDKFGASGLVTRLTTDVVNVQNAYMMFIRAGIRAPLMFIVSIIMSFRINKTISLISLGLMLLVALGAVFIFGKVMPIFNKVFKKYDKLNESVQENVKGMRVVKAYVREEYEKKKFAAASENIKNDFTKAEKYIALSNPLMSTTMYLLMLTIIFIGSLIIMNVINPLGDHMKIGEITALLTYSIQTLMSLMMLSMIFVMCTMAVESSKRIVEVLDEKSALRSPENALTTVKDGSVEFKGVSFKYFEKAKKNALANVDFRIESGETVGIIGGTGSSKTTLVQLIPRLYDATEGEVLVGGENVKKYDLNVLRDSVAMVLQKNLLFSGTIKDNLRWGNKDATEEDMTRACKMACIDSFVNALPDGLDTVTEQGGANFSGGQKQRLCIARALLKNPKIIILDDSTSAVDTKTDEGIRKSFREEIPSVTKIIIAQRISSVMYADKIIVLDEGKICGIGTHDELMESNGIYREVYSSQIKEDDKYEQQ